MNLPVLPRLLLPLVLLATACVSSLPPGENTVAVVPERWIRDGWAADNVDSLAFWSNGDQSLLIATGKESDRLLVLHPATGSLLRTVGREGRAVGELDRPNGVFTLDDYLLVVERDNGRVQVFRLPDFSPAGSFGEGDLRKPYGITAMPQGEGWAVWVTDNYDLSPGDDLSRRVVRYSASASDSFSAEKSGTVGDRDGEGALHVVESIYVDPRHERLLIAEEDETRMDIKVYDLNGRFTGQTIGESFFKAQPEGIALYECGSEGFWILTDQKKDLTRFHVLDRASLEHLGAFEGSTVANTDGVTMTSERVGPFDEGALFAVHDDRGVVAFDWTEVRQALNLDRCR